MHLYFNFVLKQWPDRECPDKKYIVNLPVRMEVFILNNELAWKDSICNFDLKYRMAENTT